MSVQVKCPECGKIFTRQGLVGHLRFFHKVTPAPGIAKQLEPVKTRPTKPTSFLELAEMTIRKPTEQYKSVKQQELERSYKLGYKAGYQAGYQTGFKDGRKDITTKLDKTIEHYKLDVDKHTIRDLYNHLRWLYEEFEVVDTESKADSTLKKE